MAWSNGAKRVQQVGSVAMTSIRQLALLAGVSPSTVFNALHNTGRIHPATRERIVKLAGLYQYTLPSAVPGYQPGGQRVIGCAIPAIDGQGDLAMLDVLSARVHREACSLLLLHTDGEPLRARKALMTFCEQGVAGIMVHNGNFEALPRATILDLWTHGISIVAYDVTPTEVPIDHVSIDEDQGGEIVIDFLFRLGHRRFLLLDALEYGLRVGHPRAIKDALTRRRLPLHFCVNHIPAEQAEAELRTHLQRPDRPTVLIVTSTYWAFRAAKIAEECGLRIPKDVSILAAGDSPFAPLHSPPLTAMHRPSYEVAHCATDLLFNRLADTTDPGERTPMTHLFPPKLMVRASCAKPPLR
jgi:DNA-binding LacI/PurR family transcriptional regulator